MMSMGDAYSSSPNFQKHIDETGLSLSHLAGFCEIHVRRRKNTCLVIIQNDTKRHP